MIEEARRVVGTFARDIVEHASEPSSHDGWRVLQGLNGKEAPSVTRILPSARGALLWLELHRLARTAVIDGHCCVALDNPRQAVNADDVGANTFLLRA